MNEPTEDPLSHMRERIDLCRRLAKSTHDLEIARALRKMADEGELDLHKLLKERQGR